LHIAATGIPIRDTTGAAASRTDGKLVQLEALRSPVACNVVAWQFLWAFDPARIGSVDGLDPSATMLGSVGFASIDRIAVHTAGGVLIIIGLLGNEWLASPLPATLLLVGAAYVPLVAGVGYALACLDETWLRWVNRFAARLARPEAT
jgi:hypothetical protein